MDYQLQISKQLLVLAIYYILSKRYAEWSGEGLGYILEESSILDRLVCSDSFPVSRLKQ